VTGVEADYRDYCEFVRPGGIIAFHDILSADTGVPRFISELERTVPIHKITHSNHLGIAWLRKAPL
jgi:hypothetical protein